MGTFIFRIMKTFYKWRLSLPKQLRPAYVKYLRKDDLMTVKSNTLCSALQELDWRDTEEGEEFWDRVDDVAASSNAKFPKFSKDDTIPSYYDKLCNVMHDSENYSDEEDNSFDIEDDEYNDDEIW